MEPKATLWDGGKEPQEEYWYGAPTDAEPRDSSCLRWGGEPPNAEYWCGAPPELFDSGVEPKAEYWGGAPPKAALRGVVEPG